tara:strand:+ start:36439 stop:36924 length:486 start_codon:yes stop_codon:yes gene_type:complete
MIKAMEEKSDEEWLRDLRDIADYQFGKGAGEGLFTGEIRIERSRTGRARQIHSKENYIATHTKGGRLSLGIEGGERIIKSIEFPAYRVVVGEESEEYVRKGKNAFAKFVIDVDPDIRPKDEVVVVGEDGHLLAVGRAKMSANAMLEFNRGVAVKVKEGQLQ